MSEPLPFWRRRRPVLLLEGAHDWVSVPGSRVGDQEPPLADRERAEESPADRRARERRYQARLELAERIGRGQVDDDERDRLLDRRRAHLRAGSYAELDEAMRTLKRAKPNSWWILQRHYIDGLPTPADEPRLERALAALSDHMPMLLRVPGDRPSPEELREERDAQILELAADGRRSTRTIADRVGASQSTVSRVLRRVAG